VLIAIRIDSNGTYKCIHDDDLAAALVAGGDAITIMRASHVEPTATGQWEADLKLSDGPVLGPFETRKAAVQAEVDWINQNLIGVPAAVSE
jgi:hypothetical protein